MHGAWRQARFRPRTRRRSPTASGRTSVRSERRAAGHHRSGSLDSFPPPFLTHFSALSSAIPPHTHHAGRVTHHAGRVIPGESSRRVAEKLYFLGSALLLAHASGMLIGACNPMSCPCTSGGGPAAQRPATRCGDRPYHAGRGGAGQPDGVRSQLRDDLGPLLVTLLPALCHPAHMRRVICSSECPCWSGGRVVGSGSRVVGWSGADWCSQYPIAVSRTNAPIPIHRRPTRKKRGGGPAARRSGGGDGGSERRSTLRHGQHRWAVGEKVLAPRKGGATYSLGVVIELIANDRGRCTLTHPLTD